jgi:UDP-glucuronate 4-epimerase
MEMQKGDVVATRADASLLKTLTGYLPDTPLDKGIGEFVTWYKAYHGKN